MVKQGYIPNAGDVVWLTFDPQAGHEQRGRRPALVLSPRTYNAKTNLALMCPITSQVKDYPFEVAITGAGGVEGVVLADQIKSLDWKARRAEFAATGDEELLSQVRERVRPLLGL